MVSDNQQKNKFAEWFSRHPVILTIGIVSSILGVPLGVFGIFTYFASQKSRELTYFVHPIRAEIYREELGADLQVFSRNKQVDGNIYAVLVQLWNKGKEPIRAEDVLEVATIELHPPAYILDANIRSVTRPVSNVQLDLTATDHGSVTIGWKILEQGDAALIQLIYVGATNSPVTLKCTLVGQPRIKRFVYGGKLETPSEQLERQTKEDDALFAIPASLCTIGITFWVFPIVMARTLRSVQRSAPEGGTPAAGGDELNSWGLEARLRSRLSSNLERARKRFRILSVSLLMVGILSLLIILYIRSMKSFPPFGL